MGEYRLVNNSYQPSRWVRCITGRLGDGLCSPSTGFGPCLQRRINHQASESYRRMKFVGEIGVYSPTLRPSQFLNILGFGELSMLFWFLVGVGVP